MNITRQMLLDQIDQLMIESHELYEKKQTSYNQYLIDKGKHERVVAKIEAFQRAVAELKRAGIAEEE